MKVTRVDVGIEKQMLVGMIVSDSFLKRILTIYDAALIDLGAVRTVAKWIERYYDKYSKAPGAMIEKMYEDERRGLGEEEAEWISEFLAKLSQEYERRGFNEQFLFDRVVGYFKRQKLEKASKKVLELLENDKVEQAEEIWLSSMKIVEAGDMGFDPFDEDTAIRLLEAEQDIRVKLTLGIPSLDKMAGVLKSAWLIMFMGPMKRGKTSALSYICIRAALRGLNAILFSFESGDEDSALRFWSSLGSLTTEENNLLEFPVFVDKEKVIVRYEDQRRPKVSLAPVIKTVKKFKRITKGRGKLRVKTFPAFGAGVEDIIRHLDMLEVYEDFIPHVIVADYVGAMTAPRGYDRYDYVTQKLKGLSQTRKAIVFSATQGTRETLEKLTMRGGDVPQDIRMLANIDVLFGLNQTEKEKEEGKMRINVVSHRHRKFNAFWQALVLQQMEAGQFYLDDVNIKAPMPEDMRKEKDD